VSHDLRNPLTAASEALRLQLGRDEESKEQLLAMSRENLLRADRMLMGLRDLMRTAGTQPEPEVVRVSAILKEVVKDLTLSRGGAALPIQFVSDLGDVLARPVQLTHLFRNLLSNALEHNCDQPDLQIEVGQETDARSGVTTFFVRDNGKGVAPELRERAFVPFRRGPDSPESGLGLGLALVDAIVTQAGGRVWIDDAPSGGAAFYFTLSPSTLEEDRDL
jgi:signal transduction histidine kinase